jgi:hypothetical protein
LLFRVIGENVELGQPQVIGAREPPTGRQGALAERQHLMFEIGIRLDARSSLAELGQHTFVADPVVEPVHLEVDADVRMQGVIPDRKVQRRRRVGVQHGEEPASL